MTDHKPMIAVLGLGAMGSRMARRLLDAGYPLSVYNRDASRADALVDAGARRGQTPAEAATGAEIVIAMLKGDDASREVWLGEHGALRALAPGALAIESSTLTPSWVRELERAVVDAEASLLDAPVAGSRPQADAGQLIYLLGGREGDVARARPVLEQLGGALHHVGPSCGAGATFKLIVNALFASQAAVVAELLGFAGSAGLDVGATAALLGELPVTSPAARGLAGAMAAGSFAPLFPIDLVEKDLRYADDAARSAGAELPTVNAVHALFRRAAVAGHGGDNISGVMQLFSRE